MIHKTFDQPLPHRRPVRAFSMSDEESEFVEKTNMYLNEADKCLLKADAALGEVDVIMKQKESELDLS